MMKTKRPAYLILTVVMALAAVLLLIGLMDVSSANAQENPGASPVRPPEFEFVVFLTDTLPVDITDLSGIPLPHQGQHGGRVSCHGEKCNQKTQLSFITEEAKYEYKFSTRLALDPVERRAVVAGTGTISTSGHKERFSFTATFEDLRDGTLYVRYEASNPGASFIIPSSPGRFEIRSR